MVQAVFGLARAAMGGAERKRAAEVEEAKKAKRPQVKDLFQPKPSPGDTHSQTDMLRGMFGNELRAGKKNKDFFAAQRPETTDRASTKRPGTSDRSSLTRPETSDRASTKRSETTDRSSLTRQRTPDRSSPTRQETDGRSDRERTASRAPSARSGDGRDGQDREVPDERAVDGKQEGDGKQKPRESKKTLGQLMRDGSKGFVRDYVDYKTANALPDVDDQMSAVTDKIGGGVEKMLGGSGGGDGGGSGNGAYPPSRMMRGDSKSGDKNESKPSVNAGRAGRVEKASETRTEVSQKTRDTLKRNFDSYLEKENKSPSASNRGSFTSELSRGSGRTIRRRMDETNGMPIEVA